MLFQHQCYGLRLHDDSKVSKHGATGTIGLIRDREKGGGCMEVGEEGDLLGQTDSH